MNRQQYSICAGVFAACFIFSLAIAAEDPKPKDDPKAKEPYESVTDKQIAEIGFEDAEVDNGVTVPLRENLEHLDDDGKKRLDDYMAKVDDWKPGKEDSIYQRVLNWLSLVSVVDIGQSEFEGEVAYVVLDRLKKDVPKEKLTKITAYFVLHPKEGKVVKSVAELGYDAEQEEEEVRERTYIYAKKLLGRLVGKLPKKDQ